MLHSNDVSKIVKHVANDVINRNMHDIVNSMSPEAQVDFVNASRSLVEISEHIQQNAVTRK